MPGRLRDRIWSFSLVGKSDGRTGRRSRVRGWKTEFAAHVHLPQAQGKEEDMENMRKSVFFRIFTLLLFWCSTFPIFANAQGSQGQDAVYSTGGHIGGSSSFIDASMFGFPGTNICAVLYGILSSSSVTYPPSGALIDARGLPGTTGTGMTCASGITPWSTNNNVNVLNVPSTILLPATSGATPTPIIISTPWIIPSNTHLIGEGDGLGSSAATTIQVSGSFNTTPGYILQFGSSSGASRISVERLTIDGLGNSVNGIVNPNAGPNSYVDHVTLYQIRGTGLLVENNADGSGPYSNITFEIGNG
jgi:hypothetical protein